MITVIIDYKTYESNRLARKIYPCINSRCSNFVELPNRYDLCIRCYEMLVEYLGSEHKLFDYSTKPALRCMTTIQLRTVLRRAEDKFPTLKTVKRGNSNSQRKWIV